MGMSSRKSKGERGWDQAKLLGTKLGLPTRWKSIKSNPKEACYAYEI
jgi:hypothetical protein